MLPGGGLLVEKMEGSTVFYEEETMRTPLGTNMTIFLLFFSLSLLEAFGSRNWVLAALWFMFGILFARADILKHR
jgi:hypothetical protein